MKVLLVVDSIKYTKNNCFLAQLYSKILESSKNFSVLELSKKETFRTKLIASKISDYSHVALIARQRTISKEFTYLVNLTSDLPVVIYDQDPWQSYIDSSESYQLYKKYKSLNLTKFILTSQWWTKYVEERDQLATKFLKMGMNSELVSEGKTFDNRKISIGFKGSVRPHRLKAINEIEKLGLKVEISTNDLRYKKYLKYLRNVKIFTHDESGYFPTDKKPVSMSTAMWVKDVEIASQGAFVLRNYHQESETYDVSRIPTILMYESVSQAKQIVNDLFKLSPDDVALKQKTAIDYIKSQKSWETIAANLMSIS